MKRLETLFSDGPHQWRVIARDPQRASALIDTNEYLVAHGDEALLTDPGGMAWRFFRWCFPPWRPASTRAG